jgi:hypothetical protein
VVGTGDEDFMDCKRLLIQTIPAVGAISLTACAPVRENIVDGTGSSIFGAWELRTWSNSGQTPYEYPTVYTSGDCITTRGFFLEIDTTLEAAMYQGTTYEDCPYYSESYSYRYPGAAEDVSTGFLRISIPGWSLIMECPDRPSDEMQCSGTSGQNPAELGFMRVDPSDIPPPGNGGGGIDGR